MFCQLIYQDFTKSWPRSSQKNGCLHTWFAVQLKSTLRPQLDAQTAAKSTFSQKAPGRGLMSHQALAQRVSAGIWDLTVEGARPRLCRRTWFATKYSSENSRRNLSISTRSVKCTPFLPLSGMEGQRSKAPREKRKTLWLLAASFGTLTINYPVRCAVRRH